MENNQSTDKKNHKKEINDLREQLEEKERVNKKQDSDSKKEVQDLES